MIKIKPQDAVLLTVLYFDCLGLPLKLAELQQNLIGLDLSQEQLKSLMQTHSLKSKIQFACGIYFLQGKFHLIEARKRREEITKSLLIRRKKLLKYLQLVPFLKSTGIGGSAAYGVATPESDIDLTIITAPNRLYLTRAFIRILERIWSFWENRDQPIHSLIFLTTKNLKLPFRDLGTALGFLNFVPIYKYLIYHQLLNQNTWINVLIPRAKPQKKFILKFKKNKLMLFIKNGLEFIFRGKIGDRFESHAKFLAKTQIMKTLQINEKNAPDIFKLEDSFISQRLQDKTLEQFKNRLSYFKLDKIYQNIEKDLSKY